AAVAGAAAHLKACGSTQSQNVRRARAIGEIARCEATLALPAPDAAPESASAQAGEPLQSGGAGGGGAPAPAGRQVQLIVHLDAAALGLGPGDRNTSGTSAEAGVGRGGAEDSDIGRASAASVGATAVSAGGVGRCENTRSPVLAEQIRSWCATPGTRVTVRPVIDLAGH